MKYRNSNQRRRDQMADRPSHCLGGPRGADTRRHRRTRRRRGRCRTLAPAGGRATAKKYLRLAHHRRWDNCRSGPCCWPRKSCTCGRPSVSRCADSEASRGPAYSQSCAIAPDMLTSANATIRTSTAIADQLCSVSARARPPNGTVVVALRHRRAGRRRRCWPWGPRGSRRCVALCC
jgi:hypothetical protein